jgi:D-arginine dehydrogenase
VPTGTFDVVVIGAGMAGAGIAAHLSQSVNVALLEKEEQPGLHSTGRSAAMFFGSYGNEQIRALSRASRPFFEAPPRSFTNGPLLKPRASLIIAGPEQQEVLNGYFKDPDMSRTCISISSSEILAHCPLIDPDRVIGGALESDSFDIEVHELHQGYLKRLKAEGGSLLTAAGILSIERKAGGWTLQTKNQQINAAVIVNASGAWADEVAALAGAARLGMEPRRRTAVLVPAPHGVNVAEMPMVMDIEERFYFKPDAGQILVSPADETLTTPGDTQPEELDVAIAVDHFETLTAISIKRVTHRWAGLRTFVADRSPVVGFDPHLPQFFWLAGQGGYGIQTAPALSELAASLVLNKPVSQSILEAGVDLTKLAPERLLLA